MVLLYWIVFEFLFYDAPEDSMRASSLLACAALGWCYDSLDLAGWPKS